MINTNRLIYLHGSESNSNSGKAHYYRNLEDIGHRRSPRTRAPDGTKTLYER